METTITIKSENNILNDDFRKALIREMEKAGVKDAEEIITKKYRDLLLEVSIKKLKAFTALLEKREFKTAAQMLSFSSSGDGYGCENYYLPLEEFGVEDFGDLILTVSCDNEITKLLPGGWC